MLTTEERRLLFIEHVQKMRTAQKAGDDVMSEYYGRQVDRALLRLEQGDSVQKELFDA